MNSRIKRILRISGFTLGALLLLVFAAIAVAMYVVFTPKQLTPLVVETANKNLNAHLDLSRVELTFFSTFPRLGLELTEGTLVSKSVRDTLWQRTDSLLAFQRAILVIDPIDYLKHRRINIHRLTIDSARVYAYKAPDGRTNWDILPTDSMAVDSLPDPADSTQRLRGISLRHVGLRHATVTFDDRETRVFANLWDTDLALKAHLYDRHSLLAVDFRNRNILYWQDGQLLVHRVAAHLKTEITFQRAQRLLTLRDALIELNGTALDLKGTVRGDSAARLLRLDLEYGLHAPSLEKVLQMIPPSIIKEQKLTATGDVRLNGQIRGAYGRDSLPLVTLDAAIEGASAQYAGSPYKIDTLAARLKGQVDPSRREASYCDLEIFRFRGAQTDILARAKAENLLGDPQLTFETQSVIDLTTLRQIFPLQEGIELSGRLNADLKLKCRLSALRNRDLGRLRILGKLETDSFVVRDTARGFELTSNADLRFIGNDRLGAKAEVRDLTLRAPALNSSLEQFTATIKTTNPQDTTRIAEMECKMSFSKLRANAGDTLRLFCQKASSTIRLQPGDRNPAKPKVGFALEADTLFCRVGASRLGMDKAGIAVTAEKARDSLWIPKGIVGFNRLTASVPQFALPIRMRKTSVTVGNRAITLRNATVRVGRSDLTASGAVYDLYGAMRRRRKLRAELSLSSRNLNCNQLMRAISFPADTVQIESDTTSTDLRLFVVPRNIDFALQTDFRRVRYGKLVLRDVHGAVDIQNQTVHLQELSMRGLGATMRTTLLYRASRPDSGYAGFDFRLRDIDIARLVEITPSLDSIVPMLRSFQGTVNCDITAEADLDSCLQLRIPSLRSAIHIEGDSLVLLDGETFDKNSKKFLFKNKERNLIDSIAVNIGVKDGYVTVYPFAIALDRYRAAVGGTQDLDMNFDYHISILKSPIPFKLGLNIKGNLDHMKFGLGRAKYKDAVTPVEIRKVDSTIADMGRQIVQDFSRLVRRPLQEAQQTSVNRDTLFRSATSRRDADRSGAGFRTAGDSAMDNSPRRRTAAQRRAKRTIDSLTTKGEYSDRMDRDAAQQESIQNGETLLPQNTSAESVTPNWNNAMQQLLIPTDSVGQ